MQRRALIVWICALSAYIMAVAARSSLGVAGVEAMDRFSIDASTLGVFSALQIGVYSAAQFPMGLALDRFGARILMSSGAALVACAQLAMALADSYPQALAARVLLGVGDATAYVSIMRLVTLWFPARHIPLMSQLTSTLGLVGQLISSWPFLWLLTGVGWNTAFVSMAGVGLGVALLVVAKVADTPDGPVSVLRRGCAQQRGSSPARISDVLMSPWAWMGFFTHWLGAGSTVVITLIWGVPFMTLGMGMSASAAATALVVFSAASVLLSPLVGQLTALRKSWRVPMVCASVAAIAGAWAVILTRPQAPAPWTAFLLVTILALPNVTATIGFDFVEQGIAQERMGTAMSVTNTGGFLAGMIGVQAIGLCLDAVSSTGKYNWADFQVSMWMQAIIWVVGVLGLMIALSQARRTPQWRRNIDIS
ncbi:MFS transporter [Schaalia vaccimaxillae]|uniref:MFS transporter n=1 Tax=Schaalia vaccimaxillae TaxID=183916 RepID=UPI0003B577BC|nr:MFS transporter [Schaalia vaccimaxillae]